MAVCVLTIFDILTLFAEMERPADTANISVLQGVFFTGPPPKKLKYGKPRLGVSRTS